MGGSKSSPKRPVTSAATSLVVAEPSTCTPRRNRPSISSSGMPAVPKPPISTVAPSPMTRLKMAGSTSLARQMRSAILMVAESPARPPPITMIFGFVAI